MVKEHHVRVYKSEENLPREDQLAFKIATVAADPVAVSDEVTDMVINRVIDNASVAIASLNRAPIVAARAQALTHGPTTGGNGTRSAPSVPASPHSRVRPVQNRHRRRRSASIGTNSAAGICAMLQTASSRPARSGAKPWPS